MRTHQEIQDKIFELQLLNDKKNKKYIEHQIDILQWVLNDESTNVTLDELQKDRVNIDFG